MNLKKMRKAAEINSGTRKHQQKNTVQRSAKRLTTISQKQLTPELRTKYIKDIQAISTYAAMIRARVQFSLFDSSFEANGLNKRIERIIEDAEYISKFMSNYGTVSDVDAFEYEHVPEMVLAVEKIIYSPLEVLQSFNKYMSEGQDITSAGLKTAQDHTV